jgi:putative transposase
MARLPRFVLAGQAHHIIQRGNNRQAIVQSDADRQHFIDLLQDAAATHKVALHAYVLMDNHLHLLATPEDEHGLSRMMQALGRRYVGWFNHKYERSGTLWEGRFRAALIESEHYFMACLRYIELNPVRAGMVLAGSDYRWSSCAHHLGRRRDPLVSDHALFWALGNTPFEREGAYLELLSQGVAEAERLELTVAVLKGRPLGSAAFLKQLADRSQRSVVDRGRGRPRKTGDSAGGSTKTNDSDPIKLGGAAKV